MRKPYGSKFKIKVAMKCDKPIAEIPSFFEIHRDLVQKWEKKALSGIPSLFSDKQTIKEKRNSEKLIDGLYRQIGQHIFQGTYGNLILIVVYIKEFVL